MLLDLKKEYNGSSFAFGLEGGRAKFEEDEQFIKRCDEIAEILFMIILMHTEGRCFQIIQSFDTKKGERFALPFALTVFTSSSPS